MDSLLSLNRCAWAGNDPLMVAYHDLEWGVPEHNDQRLFEFLILEGAQAGLSWATILNKRAAYRVAFGDFDPQVVARFDEVDRARLLADTGIVRNRLKISSAIANARAFLEAQPPVVLFGESVPAGSPKPAASADDRRLFEMLDVTEDDVRRYAGAKEGN